MGKRAAPKAAVRSPSKAAVSSPSKAARLEASPVHNEYAPVFALLAKAEGLSEQSSAMLRGMVPHCLATPEGGRHMYQKEMLQFLTEIIEGVEAKPLEAIKSIEAEIAEARSRAGVVMEHPATTEAEVVARKTEREAQEGITQAASDAVIAAKALIASEQALVDCHYSEVNAMQEEHSAYSKVMTELWAPLKAGFLNKDWRARNKLVDRFMPEFEKLKLGVALNSALPAALKTKVDDRGSFAKSTIDFADVEMQKHVAALGAKVAGAGDVAARRLGAVKTAEAAVVPVAAAHEEAMDSLVEAENQLVDAKTRHKHAKQAASDFASAAAGRKTQLATAKADLSGIRVLIWQFMELCTRRRAPVADLKLVLQPYGVLGTQMTIDGDLRSNSSEPGPDDIILDPAGLHHIQASPRNAGGAARAIYKWLGISRDERFPVDVREAIPEPLRAKYHAYGSGERRCIHVVGPNFKEEPCSRQEAVAKLSTAYSSVLAEFAASGLPKLRVLPVSGGIFSGSFGPELPELTALAFHRGFELLSTEQQEQVAKAQSLEMCIFMEQEFAGFKKALDDFFALRRASA